ncbi:hypothetical protein NTE_03257 [Candidatus Nitrososphaera evergladensis SR1]|jgi:hypothetical protein|uniref:Uncharacterized protein n=1 Tax=Candidatus Nitrososphaera evergladensis SR1 TaxID=1459636 RepID=A0A075MUF0_9ARCH|nr:hypothetical protein [Candidatus Nitrososphaera evergladensis]AIF85286.1 hypothetical protein NTE_03257 [Candidatus Nitrososphaera evergladensis SR1]
MKVRVYFCREEAADIDLASARISRQALETIYDLVWEHELKNVITIGKIWLRFQQSRSRPFGHPLKEKRPHATIAAGDIIQAAEDRYYMVMDVGVKEIKLREEEG